MPRPKQTKQTPAPAITVGVRLATVRDRAGFTQAQLAKAAGVDVMTVSTIERGINDPRVGTLTKLAKALGAPVADLVSDGEQTS